MPLIIFSTPDLTVNKDIVGLIVPSLTSPLPEQGPYYSLVAMIKYLLKKKKKQEAEGRPGWGGTVESPGLLPLRDSFLSVGPVSYSPTASQSSAGFTRASKLITPKGISHSIHNRVSFYNSGWLQALDPLASASSVLELQA